MLKYWDFDCSTGDDCMLSFSGATAVESYQMVKQAKLLKPPKPKTQNPKTQNLKTPKPQNLKTTSCD